MLCYTYTIYIYIIAFVSWNKVDIEKMQHLFILQWDMVNSQIPWLTLNIELLNPATISCSLIRWTQERSRDDFSRTGGDQEGDSSACFWSKVAALFHEDSDRIAARDVLCSRKGMSLVPSTWWKRVRCAQKCSITISRGAYVRTDAITGRFIVICGTWRQSRCDLVITKGPRLLITGDLTSSMGTVLRVALRKDPSVAFDGCLLKCMNQ